MDNEYGSINYKGKTYTVTEQPQTDNYYPNGGNVVLAYYAHATDADGNRYMVRWMPTQAWLDACELSRLQSQSDTDDYADHIAAMEAAGVDANILDDEEQACDWDNPAAVDPR
jgi:hypothetical protein